MKHRNFRFNRGINKKGSNQFQSPILEEVKDIIKKNNIEKDSIEKYHKSRINNLTLFFVISVFVVGGILWFIQYNAFNMGLAILLGLLFIRAIIYLFRANKAKKNSKTKMGFGDYFDILSDIISIFAILYWLATVIN
ncbi:MAG: hypothetical protein ABII85_02235 [Bacillota bacterium]